MLWLAPWTGSLDPVARPSNSVVVVDQRRHTERPDAKAPPGLHAKCPIFY